jgi:hypothetical protein
LYGSPVISMKNLDCILFCAVCSSFFLGICFSCLIFDQCVCLGLCSSGCVPSLLNSRSSHSLFRWFLFFLLFSHQFFQLQVLPVLGFSAGALLISSFGTRSLSCLCLLGLRSTLVFLVSLYRSEFKDFPSAEYFAAAVFLRAPVTAPAKRAPVRSQARSFL